MKKIGICLIAVLCMLFNICVDAADISYTTERTESSKATSCAYNGSTYVLAGTAGMICVSSDLQNWQEIKNVCYTDIENIIWDGGSFVFITGGNVYKSADGLVWQKSPCEFAAGNDFRYINGKYIIKKESDNSLGGAVVGITGLTSNFEDFEEINFGQAADSSKLSYTFSPEIYYKNGMYFAQGLVSNILYSSDLVNWNALPEVPNKNNTGKKLLLFACVNDEYILYYDENNTVTAYSITLSNPVWEKHELNMPKMLGDKVMQQTSGGIYCFAPFNKALCSSNGYNFETINFNTTGNIIRNEYLPLNIYENKSYAVSDGTEVISGDVQVIGNAETVENLWTGKEYLHMDFAANQVQKTADGTNYYNSDIPVSNYTFLTENGLSVVDWNGNNYFARVGGYEPPKLRGGALENGRSLFLFDEQFNIIQKHIFDGDVCDMSYCDGKYYVKIGSLTDKEAYQIYSAFDFENWIEEPNLNEVPVSNGNTVILPSYDRKNAETATYTSKDRIEEIDIKMQLEYVPVDYETPANSKVYILNGIYAAKMICNDGVYIGFSNDGVYFTKIRLSDDFAQLSKRITNNNKSIFYTEGNNIVYNEYGYKMTFDIDDIKTEFGASNAAYVRVNNKILGFDTPPVIESGRTLVPLRFIFETMGADVDWDSSTQTAIVTGNNISVRFSINNVTATIDGAAKTMDVPACLINDKTLVQLHFLSEELGFNVEWNEAEQLVTISK